MQFLDKLKDLCEDNQKCKKEDCKALHPRIFVGICIRYLHNKCNLEQNCQLIHVNEKKLKDLLQRSRINGVFEFNLCKQQNNCNNWNNCLLLHREWMNEICLDYLQANCVKKQNCHLKHFYWYDLAKEVYQKFNREGVNPENYNPTNIKHIYQNNVCTDYFEGVCPFLRNCPNHHHCNWEELGQEKFFKQIILKQCTQLDDKAKSASMNIQNTNFIDQFFERFHKAWLERKAKKANSCDVLLIIDCTGSMKDYKNIVYDSIQTILSQCTKLIDDQKLVRAAVVGYRDFDDDKQMEYREFTNNHNLILNFVKKLEFKGGNDDPENLLGGLEKAIRLDICKHQQSQLFVFLFCDAPSHGPYHENLQDDHRDSVQEGQIEEMIKKFYDLKSDRTFFICLKFTDQTDYMFKKILAKNTKLTILAANDHNLSECLSQKIEGSFKSSKLEISQKINQIPQEKKIKARFTTTPQLKFDVSDQGKIDYWKKFLIHQKENQSEEMTMLLLQEKCLELKNNEKGNNCEIFQGFDILRNKEIVIKIPKYIIDAYHKKQELTVEQQKYYEQVLDTRYLSLLIAQQLAHHFRLATYTIQEAPPIFYASPVKYQLDEPFFGVSQLYAESYINWPNIEWQKYTNNTQYSNSQAYYYTAFSHYTYQMTGKQLVITDLQGKENVLSDPVIHTLDDQIKKTLNDKLNFSKTGLDDFFVGQHPQCHKICFDLHLEGYDRGRQEKQIQEKKKLTGWIKLPDDDIVHGICEICGEFTKSTYEQYRNEKTKMICENCQDGQLEKIDIPCQCCLKDFPCQVNLKIKNLQKLESCQDCYQKCIENNQSKCIYCNSNCKKRLKTYQIEGQQIIMCIEAYQFLNTLKCQNCKTFYRFEKKIENDVYEQSIYLCSKCQSKQK